jgi:hypothetical protein
MKYLNTRVLLVLFTIGSALKVSSQTNNGLQNDGGRRSNIVVAVPFQWALINLMKLLLTWATQKA